MPATTPSRMRRGCSTPAGRSASARCLGAEAQHVGAGDGPGRDPHDVAHHAADTGVGPAEGLQGRRVVVRLDLDGEIQFVVEGDDAGVVHEDRPQPAGVQLGGRPPQGVEQAVMARHLHPAVGAGTGEVDLRLEGLVDAVLRPGLRQGLELGIAGVAAARREVVPDGSHLRHVQRQHPLPTQGGQLPVVQADHPHRRRRRCNLPGGRERRRQRAAAAALDGRIGQQPLRQHGDVVVVEIAAQFVAPRGGRSQRRESQNLGRPLQLPRRTVGHSRDGRHLHHPPRRGRLADGVGVGDGIRQNLGAEPSHLRGAELPLDVVHRPTPAAGETRHPQLGRRVQDAPLLGVAGATHLDPCGERCRVPAVRRRPVRPAPLSDGNQRRTLTHPAIPRRVLRRDCSASPVSTATPATAVASPARRPRWWMPGRLEPPAGGGGSG